MKAGENTVSGIVDRRLCLGCGTCDGICPVKAISMVYSSKNRTYVPVIDTDKCTKCGFCYRACPGLNMTVPRLFQRFDLSRHRKHPEIGAYIRCFVGHACDGQIRYMASSGGIATALTIYLLESKLSDAVVATRMKEDSLFDTESTLCMSREEILGVAGSKYCPAATNAILKEINLNTTKSVAFVGLPCHLQGINNARRFKPLSGLTEIIAIGLLCGGVKGQEGTQWVLKQRDIQNEMVENIKYRGDGFPGGMKIVFKNGSKDTRIPLGEYYDELFESWRPWRCLLCLDRTAEQADISLGDAWLPEYRYDTEGSSIIIVRTDKGMQVIEKAVADHFIEITEVDAETVASSQSGLWEDIRYNVEPALFLAKVFGKKIPNYGRGIANPGLKRSVRCLRNLARLAMLRKMTVSDPFFNIVTKVRRLKESASAIF